MIEIFPGLYYIRPPVTRVPAQVLAGLPIFLWVLTVFAGVWRVLPGFAELCRVLTGVDGFCRVFTGFAGF